jgi:murein DD-endopeptidase MepM/ murein hydrolase activator NlpD
MSKNIAKIIFLIALLLSLVLLAVRLPVQAAPAAQLTVFPTPTPGADGRILYIVQEGDTLWRIAAITGITLDELRQLNKLSEDATLQPGQTLLIGLAGPALVTVTPGPSPTPLPALPTETPESGTANLYVFLYNDRNGDSLRQADEPVIPGGAISLSNKVGTFTRTADTRSEVDTACPVELELDPGYDCFVELPEGEYNLTVAIPEGFNPTTELSRAFKLKGGDEAYISFGAQPNSEKIQETAVIPESPRRSPVLAILGGLVLLIGIGLGIYAALLARR